MNENFNMMLAGLTGQGQVMMVRIIATALLADGKKVLTTDYPPTTHRLSGMHSHIRWGGDELHANVVPEGEADLLVGFEPLECLRIGLRNAGKDCVVIMNEREVPRMIVTPEVRTSGTWRHPNIHDILNYFERIGVKNVKHFDATDVAEKEAGGVITMSSVMLGATFATGLIPVTQEAIESCLIAFVPGRWIEANLKAFKAGVEVFKRLK